MELGTPEFPKSGEVEKKEFKNPYLKEGEILLGNFEDPQVDENGNLVEGQEDFIEGQEEDDRTKFEDIKYPSKRKIRAYDVNGKELPYMYAVAVDKEDFERNQ